jgi:flagella basal body P-ring formation protein FlgA
MISLILSVICHAAAAKVVLPEEEVRAAVERFLADKLEGRGWETSVRQLSMPAGIKVSSGARDLELIAPASWNGWTPVSIALVVRVNGIVEKNVSLRLLVDARAEMVTATRQLSAGTILTAADLQVQKHDLAHAGGYPVRNIADALGKKIRTGIRAGAALRSNQLANVPIVVSGQLVTIVAEKAGVRITVTGRAKSAGGIGDLIQVQNQVSNKQLSARVVDAETVEIGF